MPLDERQDRILLHHAHLDQRFAELQAFLRTFGQRPIELLRRNETGADQLLAERRSARPWAGSGRRTASARTLCGPIRFTFVNRHRVHCTKLRIAPPESRNISSREPTPVALSTSRHNAPAFASFSAPPIRWHFS